MIPYIAIYATVLAMLAVGNASFCFICVRANNRMATALNHERARCKHLDIALRNAQMELSQMRRLHDSWAKAHNHRIGDGPGEDTH